MLGTRNLRPVVNVVITDHDITPFRVDVERFLKGFNVDIPIALRAAVGRGLV